MEQAPVPGEPGIARGRWGTRPCRSGGSSGRRNEARQEAARFAELHPTFLKNLDAELAKRNLRPEDRARLIEGMRTAGLAVPEADAAAAVKPRGSS